MSTGTEVVVFVAGSMRQAVPSPPVQTATSPSAERSAVIAIASRAPGTSTTAWGTRTVPGTGFDGAGVGVAARVATGGAALATVAVAVASGPADGPALAAAHAETDATAPTIATRKIPPDPRLAIVQLPSEAAGAPPYDR